MTNERVTFHNKTVLIMQTEERADGHAWAVLNATGIELASGDKLPSEAEARAAAVNCARQLCDVLAEGLGNERAA